MAELEDLKKMSRDGKVLPFNLALVYLGLGDRARALDNLELALAADSQMMPWLGRDAIFDPLRSEPRFVALLNKMGVTPLNGARIIKPPCPMKGTVYLDTKARAYTHPS